MKLREFGASSESHINLEHGAGIIILGSGGLYVVRRVTENGNC